MTNDIIKEELSLSYLSTIAASCGVDYERVFHDADSTDALVKKLIHLPSHDFHSTIRIQLKTTNSTNMYTDDDGRITYKLKVKNYNDLCQKSNTPIILALLVIPGEIESAVKWSTTALLLKGCMYWVSFNGNSPSSNKNSVTVHLDKTQTINSATLNSLLLKVAEEGEL